MHRTQRRVRMSQAAERIRQAATRKPKEKLTALLHHIMTDVLEASYFKLKQDAAAAGTTLFLPLPGLLWCLRLAG